MLCVRLLAAAAAVVILPLLAPAPAGAQDLQQMLNRMSRLERELSELQGQVYGGRPAAPGITATPVTPAPLAGGGMASGDMAARTEIRLQQLEAIIQQLTGKVEEVQFNLTQLSQRVEKLAGDVDFRLSRLEQGGGTAGAPGGTAKPAAGGAAAGGAAGAPAPVGNTITQGGPGADTGGQAKPGVLGYLTQSEAAKADEQKAAAKPAPAPAGQQAAAGTAAMSDNPADQYRDAFSHLTRHDYDSAERAFQKFLKDHPGDPLAGNATYWLGETFYVRGNFADAAVTFAEGYQKYPGNPKTADNLLKLGLSLIRLDRAADACLALSRLKEEFPNASVNIKRRAIDEGKRIGCKS